MDKIRVGFVGLGGIARHRHVPGLRRIEGVEIVAVANRSRESSERAAAEFGIPVVCDSWQDLVSRNDLDAVFITTWPYMHHPVTLAALAAGKHVFCQARMAMNLGEAREMHQAAVRARAEAGLVTALCPVPFGLSVDATVARLLREGYLGEPRLATVLSLTDANADPATPMNWRKDHRVSGLNALTLGMLVEVIHRWFGWTKSVTARSQIFIPERMDEKGDSVPVEIPDQFLVSCAVGNEVPVQYTISGVARQNVDRIEVFGSEGTLRYDAREDLLTGAKAGEAFEPVEIRPHERYDVKHWRVEEDFIKAIREGFDYHPNFEDGLRYMQVTEAVHDSAAQKRTVELGDPLAGAED